MLVTVPRHNICVKAMEANYPWDLKSTMLTRETATYSPLKQHIQNKNK